MKERGYIQHVITVMSQSPDASDRKQAKAMQGELDTLLAHLAEMIDLAQVSYLMTEDIPLIRAAQEYLASPRPVAATKG